MSLINIILDFDTSLLFSINHLPHPVLLDQFFLFFSFYPLITWLIIGFIIVWYEQKRDWTFILRLITALGLAGLISSGIIKPIIARPRPDLAEGQQVVVVKEKPAVLPWNNDYAFPSGHAALAFAGAYILSREERTKSKHKRLRKYYPLLFYGIAFLTAFSRIYLGKHYPLDVIAGAMLGLIISMITIKIIDIIYPNPVY